MLRILQILFGVLVVIVGSHGPWWFSLIAYPAAFFVFFMPVIQAAISHDDGAVRVTRR